DFDFVRILFRPFRTSWLIVGIALLPCLPPSPRIWGNGARIISNRRGACNKYFRSMGEPRAPLAPLPAGAACRRVCLANQPGYERTRAIARASGNRREERKVR